MTNANSAAEPQALFNYASVMTELDDGLLAESDLLEAAIRSFKATCTEFPSEVDVDVADGLRDYARRSRAMSEWVGRVGQSFLQADQGAPSWNLLAETTEIYTQPVTDAVQWVFGQHAASATETFQTGITATVGEIDALAAAPLSFADQALSWMGAAWQWGTGTLAAGARSFKDAAVDFLGSALRWGKRWWDEVIALALPLLRQAFAAFFASAAGIATAFLGALAWIGKQVVNLLWGFIWGETVFDDVAGAGVVSFIGDLLAGVFIVGDVRDIIKWWFIMPWTTDYPWWFYALMGGIAIVGIIPFIGDIGKGFLKGLLKKFVKEATEEALEALVAKLGKEGAERLVKELGEQEAKALVARLGADVVTQLLKDLSPAAIKELETQLGKETLAQLAKQLSGAEIQRLVAEAGAHGAKQLADDLGPETLKKLLGDLSPTAIKELNEQLGKDTLKQLASELTGAQIQDIVQALGTVKAKQLASDLGADTLKQLLSQFSPPAIKELSTTYGKLGVDELLQNIAIKDLKALVDKLGIAGMKDLTDKVTIAGAKLVVDDLTVDGVKLLVDQLGTQSMKDLVDKLVVNNMTIKDAAIAFKRLPVGTPSPPSNLYGYGGANIAHFLDEHTFEFLDFSKVRPSGPQSVWPPGTDVTARLEEALSMLPAPAIVPGKPQQVILSDGTLVQVGSRINKKTGALEIGQFFPISGPGVVAITRKEGDAIDALKQLLGI
jgi:predicted Zn-dependent protease with MMP-like domain